MGNSLSPQMCDIPLDVDKDEKIVRAVFSQHLERKNLRRNLFDDREDRASVMRHSHLGSDECKRLALEIRPGNPELAYKGFAVIHAQAIRTAGAEVSDSRDVYCGHAHVSTNIEIPPADDPLYSAQKFERDERLRQLKSLARYVPDPNPALMTWTGEPI
jgi:hypothetical protein